MRRSVRADRGPGKNAPSTCGSADDARRADEQEPVDDVLGAGGLRVAQPQQAGQRVAEHDPLAVAQHRQLGPQHGEPLVEHGLVGRRELRIEHLLAGCAQPLGQPELPMAGRAVVLPAVQDEEATVHDP